jgi:hypothetical protein
MRGTPHKIQSAVSGAAPRPSAALPHPAFHFHAPTPTSHLLVGRPVRGHHLHLLQCRVRHSICIPSLPIPIPILNPGKKIPDGTGPTSVYPFLSAVAHHRQAMFIARPAAPAPALVVPYLEMC